MKLTVLCLFAALTAGAQSTIPPHPATDAEKIADALRAGPDFITEDKKVTDDGLPRLRSALEPDAGGLRKAVSFREDKALKGHMASAQESWQYRQGDFAQAASEVLLGQFQRLDRNLNLVAAGRDSSSPSFL